MNITTIMKDMVANLPPLPINNITEDIPEWQDTPPLCNPPLLRQVGCRPSTDPRGPMYCTCPLQDDCSISYHRDHIWKPISN